MQAIESTASLRRKLCSDSGEGCKKDSDCCDGLGLTCEGSGNSKTCTGPTSPPVDLCAGDPCSAGGVYATCEPSTGECGCIHEIDTYPNCLGDLPCTDDAECQCDDTIFYPCPHSEGSTSVKGDCTKMKCNPNYRGGVGQDNHKCICDSPYYLFTVFYSWPSCISCCEQDVSGWPNYCYKYPNTNSYLPISCPVCTDTTDTSYQYPQALSFECGCQEGGTWPECDASCAGTMFPSKSPITSAPTASPMEETCAEAGVKCKTATNNGMVCCNGCESGGNPNNRVCL